MTAPHWTEYARGLGINPYHPDDWTPRQRHDMTRFQLDRFIAKWRWLRSIGQLQLIRETQGRAALINAVRADLFHALRPFPSRPYVVCPCHPQRLGGSSRPGVDPWAVDRKLGESSTAAALRWLRETFGRTNGRR